MLGRFLYFCLLNLCAGLAITSNATRIAAQETVDAVASELPTADLLQQRIKEVEGATTLSEPQRTEIIGIYNRALSELEAISKLETRIKQLQESTESVAEDRAKAEADLKSLETKPTIDRRNKTVTELNAEARTAESAVQEAEKGLDAINDQPQQRTERRLAIPGLLAELNRRSNELSDAAIADTTGELAELSDAKSALNQIEQRKVQLEIESYQDEIAFYDASQDLLPLQIEVARQRVAYQTQLLRLWQTAAAARQNRDVQDKLLEALAKEGSVPDELREIAKTNVEKIEVWGEQADTLAQTDQSLHEVRQQRVDWDERFDKARAMIVSQGGVTSTVGLILRSQGRDLPDLRQLKLARHRNQRTITNVRDELFRTNEELSELADLDASVANELTRLSPQPSPERLKELEAPTRALLEQRVTVLQGLRTTDRNYLQSLLNLALAQDTLYDVVKGFSQFIDEQVLWIPSSRAISLDDISNSGDAISAVLSPKLWQQVLEAIPSNLVSRPFPQILILAIAAVLLWKRRRIRQRLTKLGNQASARTCRRFDVTVYALIATIALALVVPVILMWLAVNLTATDNAALLSVTAPIGEALKFAAFTFFCLRFWFGLVGTDGLGEAHFDWSDNILKVSRHNLRWFTPIVVVSAAFHRYFDVLDAPQASSSVGRLALMIGLLAAAFFAYRIFSPTKGVFSHYLLRNAHGWLNRTRRIWYPLVVISPVIFAGLAATGYDYTAAELSNRMGITLYFLGSLFVAEAMALRWVKINRRELAFAQAKERLEALEHQQDEDFVERSGGVVEGDLVDLTVVNEQSRHLFKNVGFVVGLVGLYFIWQSVLPALTRLDDIRLWPTSMTVVVEGGQSATGAAAAASSGSGASSPARTSSSASEWVTASDLLATLLILFLTFIGTRNIPGLLEISILKRLPLDAALRYAITTVTRYGIIIGGVTIAFAYLGVSWQKIQWLVAAVSVGLGFGLQEIFANFVSGLILLFERPLRAGDIVTVGNVTGRVVQIKMRATTIQDWDRKELVVPNKEFITSHLLNWTLTDTTNRLVITVGVGYASDPRQVREVLLKVLEDHPDILESPGPSVAFDLFGDSALNFTIRAFLADMDNRISVTSELHAEILKRLGEAGIEIPFPQRDVHIKSSTDDNS